MNKNYLLGIIAIIVAILAIPNIEATWWGPFFSSKVESKTTQAKTLSQQLTKLAQTDPTTDSEILKLKILNQFNHEAKVFNHIGVEHPVTQGTIHEYLETLHLSNQIEKIEVKDCSNKDNTDKINRLDIVEISIEN